VILETLLSALGIDAAKGGLKGTLRALKAKFSGRKYRILLSTALRELLKEHPDVSLAEANILAAEATGIQPSPELVRTKEILGEVKRHTTKKAKKKVAKRAAKKKAAKKAAKKKAAKK
jgi:hypothetical protein